MSEPYWFSRARLREDAPVGALLARMLGEDKSSAHNLVWALFADSADRKRDFLFREAEPGLFYLLSARKPEDPHNLFDIDPPKPFVLDLKSGDRLNFHLRANATKARPQDRMRKTSARPSRATSHDDIVMRAIRNVEKGPARRAARTAAIEEEGTAWLARQGAKSGFRFDARGIHIDGYRVQKFPRSKGAMTIGSLDFEGILTVEDPKLFLQATTRGFGRAKAFGFGLMLIRRA